MKILRTCIISFICAFSLLFIPVAAITTGNMTGAQPSGVVQVPLPTYVTTTSMTYALPSVDIPQNVGFVPIWLAIGIILIIIALSGLLWRYFHPKYVPKEENE
jgi:hypothetical protein